jgi:hypothetical protein
MLHPLHLLITVLFSSVLLNEPIEFTEHIMSADATKKCSSPADEDDTNAKHKPYNWNRVKAESSVRANHVSPKAVSSARWICTDRRGQAILVIFAMIGLAFCIGFPTLINAATSARQAMKGVMQSGAQVLTAHMIPAPNYAGELSPCGQVSLRFGNDQRFLVTFNMKGLEDECANCQFSIAEATTCANMTSRDHFNRDMGIPNLGEIVSGRSKYTASKGISTSSTVLFTGYAMDEYNNRAVYVYDHTNSLLACGLLNPHPPDPSTMLRFFAAMNGVGTYSQFLVGVIETEFYPDKAFLVKANVQGAPRNCDQCDLHIHEGDCLNVGDNFWNRNRLRGDPWNQDNGARYISDANGAVRAHKFWMLDGFNFGEHLGKAIVMSDASGTIVACGTLTLPGSVSQSNGSPATSITQ